MAHPLGTDKTDCRPRPTTNLNISHTEAQCISTLRSLAEKDSEELFLHLHHQQPCDRLFDGLLGDAPRSLSRWECRIKNNAFLPIRSRCEVKRANSCNNKNRQIENSMKPGQIKTPPFSASLAKYGNSFYRPSTKEWIPRQSCARSSNSARRIWIDNHSGCFTQPFLDGCCKLRCSYITKTIVAADLQNHSEISKIEQDNVYNCLNDNSLSRMFVNSAAAGKRRERDKLPYGDDINTKSEDVGWNSRLQLLTPRRDLTTNKNVGNQCSEWISSALTITPRSELKSDGGTWLKPQGPGGQVPNRQPSNCSKLLPRRPTVTDRHTPKTTTDAHRSTFTYHTDRRRYIQEYKEAKLQRQREREMGRDQDSPEDPCCYLLRTIEDPEERWMKLFLLQQYQDSSYRPGQSAIQNRCRSLSTTSNPVIELSKQQHGSNKLSHITAPQQLEDYYSTLQSQIADSTKLHLVQTRGNRKTIVQNPVIIETNINTGNESTLNAKVKLISQINDAMEDIAEAARFNIRAHPTGGK